MENSPPLENLFNTNSAPTDQQAEELKTLIKAEQGYLDDLNRQILVLVERRDAHARILKRHCAPLSPVRRIPSEILLSIFERACLKGVLKVHTGPPPKPEGSFPPVVLSHVCRDWRRLSLNYPILWSEIRFLPPPFPSLPLDKNNPAALEDFSDKVVWYKHHVKNMITRHQIYVSRSDPSPLTISVNASDHPAEDADPPCVNKIIVDMLCGSSTRWKNVDLYLTISTNDSPLLRLLELSKQDVPHLELLELDLCVFRPWLFSADVNPLPAVTGTELLQAPRLKSLNFNRFPSRIQYHIGVNCRTVTDLRIGEFVSSPDGPLDPPAAVQHIFEVLTSFPNLIRCSLSLKYSPDIDPATFPYQSPPISLPYLTSLSIRGSPLPLGLASSLDLPSLTILAIHHNGDPEDETTSEFVVWIRKFGHQLTELMFHYRCLTQSALVHCFEHLPNLTTLRMFGTNSRYPGTLNLSAMISDSLLERLTPTSLEGGLAPPLCPKLKKVSFWPLTIEFTEKAILKFLAARRGRHLRAFPSSPDSIVSLLDTAIVCFNTPRRRDLRQVLAEDDSLDLEEFILVVQVRQFGPFALRPGALASVQNTRFEELVAEDIDLMGY